MFKIQTLNSIAHSGLAQLPAKYYEVGTEFKDPDAILVRSHNMHDLTFEKALKVVGRAGSGVNNIPVDLFTQKGIPVMNAPGANANAVRELVIAGMLLASRNICQAWDFVRKLDGTDSQINTQIEKEKKQFAGFELMGKTLGIVGLGNIGVKVANAAISLGMKVIGFDPTITVSRAWELSSEVKQAHNIEDVLKHANFVSFHVPLTPETKNLINPARFQLMKKHMVLLNFSREGIIDNEALEAALIENKVHAYVTDFPSTRLLNNPRVISLPHLGASTAEAEENSAVMVVKQVKDFLENGNIANSVNFPTIEMPFSNAGIRLGIVNANVPNMVAQISSALASGGLNIVSLLNKSRDDIAYTLVDVNDEVSASLLKNIESIEGVIHVRKLTPALIPSDTDVIAEN